MQLKSIGVGSAAKIAGIFYGGLGLIIGGFAALASLVGAGIASATQNQGADEPPAWMTAVFGLGAIVILPVFYGVIGVVIGALTAALYNLAARVAGGIELDIR